MKVGFIGLGRMGAGMAGRIQGAGYALTVFDAIATQTAPFAAAGARVATSIADLCQGRDVVVSLLVAAPVLGRPDLAAAGQLGIVVAGPIDAATRVRPLLDAMGRRIFEAGPK